MFNEKNSLSLWSSIDKTFDFSNALTNFLELLDKDLLAKTDKPKFYTPNTMLEKNDDGTATFKTKFNKKTDTFTLTTDKDKREFTLYIKSEPSENVSSATMVSDTIPEGYDVENHKVSTDNGYLTITFGVKCGNKCESKCSCGQEEELTKQLEEADKNVCELDSKMESLNEKMHDAIDDENFDLLHDLAGEYRKVEEELEKAEEERHQIGVRLYDLKHRYGHECCHAGKFEIKSNKWKRDDKGRFVKQ